MYFVTPWQYGHSQTLKYLQINHKPYKQVDILKISYLAKFFPDRHAYLLYLLAPLWLQSKTGECGASWMLLTLLFVWDVTQMFKEAGNEA